MDDVKEFSNELNSLYTVKPPISKAKMNSITRLALKSLKYYKHIVQSIEKFIHKCQPEYKLPGLYVIDSIVRQSRHQFGADKDPFAARFSRNIAATFHDLLTCSSQEICKIVRVLNLWQKNSMFSPQIIQPLLDMAANPTNHEIYTTAQRSIQQVTGLQPLTSAQHANLNRLSLFGDAPSTSELSGDLNTQPADLLKAFSSQPFQLLLPLLTNPQLYLHLLQQQLILQQATSGSILPEVQQAFVPQIDSNLMAQIQALTAALMARIGTPQQQQQQIQQTSNATTAAGLASNLDATTDSLQSSDFHGDLTSPVVSSKKAELSDIMTDTEDDKAADQMSVSSISTPAINPTEVSDGGLPIGPAYSPSCDHMDAGHFPPSDIMPTSKSAATSSTLTNAATISEAMNSEASLQMEKAERRDNDLPSKCAQKNNNSSSNYTLFSPVSPINSVPNSPSEESGTPVLDEIPSPMVPLEQEVMEYGNDEKIQTNRSPHGASQRDRNEKCGQPSNRSSLGNPGEEERFQTPEEGEIVANEVDDDGKEISKFVDGSSGGGGGGGRPKRKRSKRSKDRKDKLKVLISERSLESVKTVEIVKNEPSPGVGKKDAKKKKRRNKERHSIGAAVADVSKRSQRDSLDEGSASLLDQIIVVDNRPRRFYVVLDEVPSSCEGEKSKRKRSPSPRSIVVYPDVHPSRRNQLVSKERLDRSYEAERPLEKRSRLDGDDPSKVKSRQKHSKEHSHRDRTLSSTNDRANAARLPNSSFNTNGPTHRSRSSSRSRRARSKSPRKRSPRKDSKRKGSRSRDECIESLKSEKPAVKNRIYRAKSVSLEPVVSSNRKSRSRSKEKKSSRKVASSKRSKRDSPARHNETSNHKKTETKTKPARSKPEETGNSKSDKSKLTKEKHEKISASSLPATRDDASETTKKDKYSHPAVKEKHACVSSTTLWIGPIGRHTKKEELKKELYKHCKPTLVDMVAKQSCVYVAFETRKEAVDLMDSLNDCNLCGKTVKVTWAPGSGIKQSKFLSRWDVDIGATYIPWDKLPYNMEAITQGGVLDPSSVPEPASSRQAEIKGSEKSSVINTTSLSDCHIISFQSPVIDGVDDDDGDGRCIGPSKLSNQKRDKSGNRSPDVQLVSCSKTKSHESKKKTSKRKEEKFSKVEEKELSIGSLPLPPLPLPSPLPGDKLPPVGVSVEPELIEDDDVEIQGSESPEVSSVVLPTVKQTSVEELAIVKREDKKIEVPGKDEAQKSAAPSKFRFSIEGSDRADGSSLKKVSDFENDVESLLDDKTSDLSTPDELPVSEVASNKSVADKKTGKANKPEILKGKIKFGVISAFSGWANKQKMASLAAAPAVVAADEKPKEDARSLYESLMERINSKSKSSQQNPDSNKSVTFDEEFLSTIKVPSPRVLLSEKTKGNSTDKKLGGDMSEAYDPFENNSDSGGNSPANRNVCDPPQATLADRSCSRPSLDCVQTFGHQQVASKFNRSSHPPPPPPPPLNNFVFPYQHPSFPQNMPFGNHSGPVQNIPMMPALSLMSTPQHMTSMPPPVPSTGAQQANSKAYPPSLLPPHGFASQQSAPSPRPLLQSRFGLASSAASNVGRVATPFDNSASLNMAFNVPPPGMPLNRFPNPSFFSSPENPKHAPNSSLHLPPLNASTTPANIFPIPPRPAAACTTSNFTGSATFTSPSNTSALLPSTEAHLHRRPPLLSEPPATVSHFRAPSPSKIQPPMNAAWAQSSLIIDAPPTALVLQNKNLTQTNPFPGISMPQGQNFNNFKELPRSALQWVGGTQGSLQSSTNIAANISANVPVSMMNLPGSQIAPPVGQFVSNPPLIPSLPVTSLSNKQEQSLKEQQMFARDQKDGLTINKSSSDRNALQIPVICQSAIVDRAQPKEGCINQNTNLRMERQRIAEPGGIADRKVSGDQRAILTVPPDSGGPKPEPGKEQFFKIESVVSNVKHLPTDGQERSSNAQKDPIGNPDRLPAPPAFFNIPPPSMPLHQARCNIPPVAPARQSVAETMDTRPPAAPALAQEFSKLLNSPVTFDSFSKNVPPAGNIRMVATNANPSSNFVQRPAGYNDGLLGPAPPGNFPPPPPPPLPALNKALIDRPPSGASTALPNDFNRNLPPPFLPRQVGPRGPLFPGAVLDAPNKNLETRLHPRPLLNPSEFLNSLQPNQRQEQSFRQKPRLDERDSERRNFGRPDGDCSPRFQVPPRKPFDYSWRQKNRFRNDNPRFDVRGGMQRFN